MASSAQYFLSAVFRFHPLKPARAHPVLFCTSIGDHDRFIPLPPRASKRYQDYSQDRDQSISAQDAVVIASDPRTWIGGSGSVGGGVDDDVNDDDDEEEEDERSWDLLARLLKSMFRKISRQARKLFDPCYRRHSRQSWYDLR
ncbi:hypothetical protein HPP92_020624 [Vanilla planifolia]|uniref:Uncharacterized protein n=1 Tax=Vanilla planifolia TaxID=51239 RepID=A0A835Q1L9_VANPL|nr:hypothetical protein HPP92_020624 [Vanilla planifolia]